MFRDVLPDRLARWTGSRRSAVHHLRRTIQRGRVRKRVRPSERVGPPFGRVTPEDALSGELVEHGPRGAPQALRVQYRLPGAGYRLAFVARGEDPFDGDIHIVKKKGVMKKRKIVLEEVEYFVPVGYLASGKY